MLKKSADRGKLAQPLAGIQIDAGLAWLGQI